MDQITLDGNPNVLARVSQKLGLSRGNGRRINNLKSATQVYRFKGPPRKSRDAYLADIPYLLRKKFRKKKEPKKHATPNYKTLGLRRREKVSHSWDHPITACYPQCSPPFYIPNTIFAGMNVPTLTSGSKFEQMLDVANGKKYRYNPMVHEKYLSFRSSLPVFLDPLGQVVVQFNNPSTEPGINLIELCREISRGAVTPTEVDDFAARAEESFITVVPTEAFIINNAIEIAQLLEGNAKAFTKLKTTWKHSVARFKLAMRNYKAIGRTPGNFWVAWRFAIRPTLKDAGICFHTLAELKQRIDHLRKLNHVPHTKRYRTKLHNISAGDVYWSNHRWAWLSGNWSPGGIGPRGIILPPSPPAAGTELPCRIGVRIKRVTTTLAATGTCQFDILNEGLLDSDFQFGNSPAYATLCAEIAGLYRPWDVEWEAIPFSWAVDWCLSEREKLNRTKQFREGWLMPYGWAKILDSCWSLKISFTFEIVYTHDVNGSAEPIVIGEGAYNRFERQNGLPDLRLSPFRIPNSVYQGSILTAILADRTSRRLPVI